MRGSQSGKTGNLMFADLVINHADGSVTPFPFPVGSFASGGDTTNGYVPNDVYVLDQSDGKMTELAVTENGSELWQHTNVTGAGMFLATYDVSGLHFLLNDALGTRRAQTDGAGVPEQTCQSLPFGDALNCTGNLVAPNERHLTGKETYTESGLDYFGARYYESSIGRFMSLDPGSPSPLHLLNPQRWSCVQLRTE